MTTKSKTGPGLDLFDTKEIIVTVGKTCIEPGDWMAVISQC